MSVRRQTIATMAILCAGSAGMAVERTDTTPKAGAVAGAQLRAEARADETRPDPHNMNSAVPRLIAAYDPSRAAATDVPNPGQTPRFLPDYHWAVAEQSVILRPGDLGLAENISIYPEGLTFARNGDLLLAACCPHQAATFIMRSSDRGRTWTRHGVLEHRGDEGYSPRAGFVEGMHMTASGRLVLIYYILRQDHERTGPGHPYYIPFANSNRFTHLSSRQWGAYSDDEGETWQWTPMDISPFRSMDAEASSQIFEGADGTLVASFRGHLNPEEMEAFITSNGIVRSHDGGLSWGDASVMHRAVPGSGDWFNESQVLPLHDGRWLCMMRLNPNYVNGAGFLIMCRAYSSDRGRTWTHPVHTRFHGGEPGMGYLPDGGILCTQTGGYVIDVQITEDGWPKWQPRNEEPKLLYEISYDSGLTWSYWGDLYLAETGSREHIGSPIIRPLDPNTAIALYHRGEKGSHERFGGYGPQFIGASWLRKVSADDPAASRLRYPLRP